MLNGVIGSSCGDECQTPLRALYNYDRLAAAVGTPPVCRYWQSEWPDLRIRQALLLAQSRGPDRAARFVEQINSIGHEEMRRAFLPGGDHSIDNDLQGTYRLSVAWKVSNGWEEEEAEAASLLCVWQRRSRGLPLSGCGARRGARAIRLVDMEALLYTMAALVADPLLRSTVTTTISFSSLLRTPRRRVWPPRGGPRMERLEPTLARQFERGV